MLGWSAPALAQSPPDADALLRRGLDARRHRRDGEALALFQQAYAAAPSPMLTVQIALAEQALGRWRDAWRHLREALDAHDAWVDARRASLEGALATVDAHLGTLDIDGAPPGADVSLDGARVATLPLPSPLRWPIGTASLTVSLDGYVAVTRQVAIQSGALNRESVTLVRREPPPPIEPPPPAIVVASPTPAPPSVPPAPRPMPRRRATVGAGPWALGIAGVAVGVVGGAVSFWVRQDAQAELLDAGCVVAGDGLVCPPGNRGALESVHARGEAASLAANVSLAVGGVALAGALTWAIVRLSSTPSAARAVRFVPHPGAAPCDLVVSF